MLTFSGGDSVLEWGLSRLTASQSLKLIHRLYRIPGFTERHLVCPVCGQAPDSVEFVTPLSPLDHCANCDHVYARRTPKKLVLQLMYSHLDYWKQDKEHQGISGMEYGPHWAGFIQSRLSPIRNCGALDGSAKRVYEIGCSEGILLHEFQRLGHEARGCECNRPTAEKGMRALGVDIAVGLFEELDIPPRHFDLVMSFHTIEHICDLAMTFEKIVTILKPDGMVFIEVPTGPEEYANPDHVQFFSDASLRRLLERYFEVAETIPNGYRTSSGTEVRSLYGVGRRPRQLETVSDA